jgi:hypothetical protein
MVPGIDTDAVLRGGRRRRRVRAAAAIAIVAAVGTLMIGGTRHPGGVAGPTPSAGACQDFTSNASGSPRDQAAVLAAAHSVLTTASGLPTNNLANVIARPADLTVEVLWVGPVPKAMTDVAASAASKGVTVEFTAATYTRTQMRAALQLASRVAAPTDDPASQGLTIAGGGTCPDGSGIKVTIAQKANNEPATSVPPAFAAAIQSSVGQMPVWVEPGSGAITG